jgi:hypothetical protein
MSDPFATPHAPPYALPEVTRALRAFGAACGQPGSDHDRWFAPLVAALRTARAHVESDPATPWRAVERVDAARTAAAFRAVLAALAAERAAGSAPDARALEAELEELCAPVLAALDDLGAHAAAVLAADEAGRPHAWRAWATALGGAFASADRCWIAALPVLADARGSHGRLWRRLLRGRGGGVA